MGVNRGRQRNEMTPSVERKLLRTIFGPLVENGRYRRRDVVVRVLMLPIYV